MKAQHGRAHGEGIYTANINAGFLAMNFARGFEDRSSLFLCVVAPNSATRHVSDAQITLNAKNVIPLFIVSGRPLPEIRPVALGAKPEPVRVSILNRMAPLVDSNSVLSSVNVEKRMHPKFGPLSLDELSVYVPPHRIQAAWSIMKSVVYNA